MIEEIAPKSGYKNGARTREQLILAASGVFAEFGYDGGSIRKIAAEVGVSHSAFARHFANKEELLIGVLEHWDQLVERPSLPRESIFDFIDSIKQAISFNTKNRGYLNLFLTLATEATRPGHPAHTFIQNRYNRLLQDFITQLSRGVENDQLRTMTAREIEAESRSIIALMDGLELQWLNDPTFDLVEIFNLSINAMASGWLVKVNS